MNNTETLKIINALADGVDPTSGELLPDDSLYQSAQITRALSVASNAIERIIKSDIRRKCLPDNAGKPWTADEDLLVAEGYIAGITITQIALNHGRTSGAIQARLLKMGEINVVPDK